MLASGLWAVPGSPITFCIYQFCEFFLWNSTRRKSIWTMTDQSILYSCTILHKEIVMSAKIAKLLKFNSEPQSCWPCSGETGWAEKLGERLCFRAGFQSSQACHCVWLGWLSLCFISGSSFSGRVFRMTFLMLAVSLAIPLLGAMMLLESPIDPQSFR